VDDDSTPHGATGPSQPGPDPAWRAVRLPFRPPLPLDGLITFFGLRAIPGVEDVVEGRYVRSVRLPGGIGIVAVDGVAGTDGGDDPVVTARVRVAAPPVAGPAVAGSGAGSSARDLDAAVAACRRAFDLDADPVAVDAGLGADPLLAPLVAAAPGRRAPGHVDAAELAMRAVLGQQVSLLAARRLAGRLAELCGDPLATPVGAVTTVFPTPAAIADADLDRIGMPGSRRATLRTLAQRLADRDIDLASGADPDEVERRLLEIRGIGPWTASYVRMRGLGDRDVLLATDLGVRHALDRLGAGGIDPADLARRWSPWASYAVQHLWASLA
jgi:AraC family transcriptional regulator of adaptative response / DNA-3-methyladenine glycosylase II